MRFAWCSINHKKKKQKNHKGSCGVVHHRCTKLWNSIQVTFFLLFDTFDTHKLCTICVHEICRCVLFALLLSNKCGQHVLHICFPDGLKKKHFHFNSWCSGVRTDMGLGRAERNKKKSAHGQTLISSSYWFIPTLFPTNGNFATEWNKCVGCTII